MKALYFLTVALVPMAVVAEPGFFYKVGKAFGLVSLISINRIDDFLKDKELNRLKDLVSVKLVYALGGDAGYLADKVCDSLKTKVTKGAFHYLGENPEGMKTGFLGLKKVPLSEYFDCNFNGERNSTAKSLNDIKYAEVLLQAECKTKKPDLKTEICKRKFFYTTPQGKWVSEGNWPKINPDRLRNTVENVIDRGALIIDFSKAIGLAEFWLPRGKFTSMGIFPKNVSDLTWQPWYGFQAAGLTSLQRMSLTESGRPSSRLLAMDYPTKVIIGAETGCVNEACNIIEAQKVDIHQTPDKAQHNPWRGPSVTRINDWNAQNLKSGARWKDKL